MYKLQYQKDNDKFVDFGNTSYKPISDIRNKLKFNNIFINSFQNTKYENILSNLLLDLSNLNRENSYENIIWQVKNINNDIEWEIYFYSKPFEELACLHGCHFL